MYRSRAQNVKEGRVMSSLHHETTILRLTVWLNAWRSGHISAFDAANACESITTSLDVTIDNIRHPWIDLLALHGPSATPFRVALPVPGDPDGLPGDVLATFDTAKGIAVMDSRLVIGITSDETWHAMNTAVAPVHYDFQHARMALLQALGEAQESLSHLDLVGSRITADEVLKDLSFGHLPPTTPTRTTDALEQALRIATLARIARDDSAAVASRSQDHERARVLLDLERKAQQLLQAAASSAH